MSLSDRRVINNNYLLPYVEDIAFPAPHKTVKAKLLKQMVDKEMLQYW